MKLIQCIFIKLLLASIILFSASCTTIISSTTEHFADNLQHAILNHNDLETVKDAIPAYLLLLDSIAESNPSDSRILMSTAELYAAYASIFVEDDQRAKQLVSRAKNYAEKGMCNAHKKFCRINQLNYKKIVPLLAEINIKNIETIYAYTSVWATWIQVNADDWSAIADLPKVEALGNRIIELEPNYDDGGVYLLLGVLNSQLPPAYGGNPEKAKGYFEKATELSDGKNLIVKLYYAQEYARLVFDKELHDKLLNEVIIAEPMIEGYTLINVLAQQRARQLLATSDDYF